MPFRFGRNFRSRSRLFADLVKTLYSSGSEDASFEQITIDVETDNQTNIDSAEKTSLSAVTYFINAVKHNDSHYTMINAVLSTDKTLVEFTEYGTVQTNGALAHYDVAIDDSDNVILKANPTDSGVSFSVTRILVE